MFLGLEAGMVGAKKMAAKESLRIQFEVKTGLSQ
jgi:hypothetical protein